MPHVTQNILRIERSSCNFVPCCLGYTYGLEERGVGFGGGGGDILANTARFCGVISIMRAVPNHG